MKMASLFVEESAVDREQIDKSLFNIVDFQEILNQQQDKCERNVFEMWAKSKKMKNIVVASDKARSMHSNTNVSKSNICLKRFASIQNSQMKAMDVLTSKKNNTHSHLNTDADEKTETHLCTKEQPTHVAFETQDFTFWTHAHRISYVANENNSDWNVCRTPASSKHVDKPSFEFSIASHEILMQ